MRRFEFSEEWEVPFPRADVHRVLSDVERYPEWWPQVLACAKTGPDDGLVVCRSVLPYSLELALHATSRAPELLETSIGGDLEGWVRFRLTSTAEGTRVGFEQEVTVTAPAMKVGAFLGRPVLEWNHARMMAGCREGLVARLSG